MKNLVLLFTLLLTTTLSFADTVTFLDGRSFDGEVKRIKKCSVVFKTHEGKYAIPAEDIFKIEFSETNNKALTSYLALADNDKCMKGTLDASNLHGKETFHVAMGVLFGPFAFLVAAASSPTPHNSPNTEIKSKNRDLFSDLEYLECYKKKARNQNMGKTAIGWGIWVLLIIVL